MTFDANKSHLYAKLVFGTMRMHERRNDANYWVRFLSGAHDRGVQTLHSSDEYESFPLLLNALKALNEQRPDIKFRHMVKLAEPSFNDAAFNSGRFARKLACYRDVLRDEHGLIVQWMSRAYLKQDSQRIESMLSWLVQLHEHVASHKAKSDISAFYCFPYTRAFADVMMRQAWCDGLAIYRNPLEQEYDDYLEPLVKDGRGFYAIRPLAAGKAMTSGQSAGEVMRFSLNLPQLRGMVVSPSTLEHLDALVL